MEKKEYVAPKMEIVDMDLQGVLLCESGCSDEPAEDEMTDYTGNLW